MVIEQSRICFILVVFWIKEIEAQHLSALKWQTVKKSIDRKRCKYLTSLSLSLKYFFLISSLCFQIKMQNILRTVTFDIDICHFDICHSYNAVLRFVTLISLIPKYLTLPSVILTLWIYVTFLSLWHFDIWLWHL